MEPTRDKQTPPNSEPSAAPPPPASEQATSGSEIPQVRPQASSSTPDPSAATPGKADLGKRFIAMLIDGILAAAVSMIPLVGWLVAGAYMVVRDGLEIDFMDRRSLGKKIMKLRPVRLDGQPMDIEASARRNWMWAIGYLAALPIIGWILSPIIGLIALGIGIFEIYKVVSDDEGRRWGDEMGGTKVIEVAE